MARAGDGQVVIEVHAAGSELSGLLVIRGSTRTSRRCLFLPARRSPESSARWARANGTRCAWGPRAGLCRERVLCRADRVRAVTVPSGAGRALISRTRWASVSTFQTAHFALFAACPSARPARPYWSRVRPAGVGTRPYNSPRRCGAIVIAAIGARQRRGSHATRAPTHVITSTDPIWRSMPPGRDARS